MEKKEGGRKGYPTSGQQYPVHMAQDSIPVDPISYEDTSHTLRSVLMGSGDGRCGP